MSITKKTGVAVFGADKSIRDELLKRFERSRLVTEVIAVDGAQDDPTRLGATPIGLALFTSSLSTKEGLREVAEISQWSELQDATLVMLCADDGMLIADSVAESPCHALIPYRHLTDAILRELLARPNARSTLGHLPSAPDDRSRRLERDQRVLHAASTDALAGTAKRISAA